MSPTTTLTEDDRFMALQWAAHLTTDSHDASKVAANAEPLIEWVGQARDRDDVHRRQCAVKTAFTNASDNLPYDDPTTRRDNAAVLYQVLSGNTPAEGYADVSTNQEQ